MLPQHNSILQPYLAEEVEQRFRESQRHTTPRHTPRVLLTRWVPWRVR